MVRFALAGLVLLALVGATSAEEDNGSTLVDLFAKTCARRPGLPSDMALIAAELGFVQDGGPITAEMQAGPQIDIVYTARLMKRGEKVASISAYFSGPANGPTVSCAVSAFNVSAEALPALIERSLKVRDRTDEPAPDDNRIRAKWRLGAAADADTLEMWTRRNPPRLASLNIAYRGGKR
jgi:hypothetical protein